MHATDAVATHTFCPGTKANHLWHANCFMEFCDHNLLQFIHSSATFCYSPVNPSERGRSRGSMPDWLGYSLLIYHISHLPIPITKEHPNYISRVRFLHKQLGLTPQALDSFPITPLQRAADITCTHHHSGTAIYCQTSSIICGSSPPV